MIGLCKIKWFEEKRDLNFKWNWKLSGKKDRKKGGKKGGRIGAFGNPLEPQNLTLQSAHLGWVVDPWKSTCCWWHFTFPFPYSFPLWLSALWDLMWKSKIPGECAIWYNISSPCDKYGRNEVANPGYCYKTRSTECSLDNPTPSLLHITHKGFSLSSSLCHKLNHDTPILYIWTYQLRRATNCRRSYSSVYCDWSQSSSKVLNISFMPLPPPPSPVTTALPSSSLLFFDMPTYKCNQRSMWALIP